MAAGKLPQWGAGCGDFMARRLVEMAGVTIMSY
ncbi:Acyl-CoA dehydrogenase C-terminal domain-containing protein, partial [uncultured Duncaniella sp.]